MEKVIFNHNSRKNNVIMSSMVSAICKVINMALGFGYRSLFLKVFTIHYLGINGLFTNILGMLALAELGITNAIVYRFYDPISKDDIKKVGQLMRFFRKTYQIITVVIVGLGLLITPFLGFFIKDTSEVPEDVNLYVVFLLFLLQTASTYVFSYKLTLLTADQKQYVYSILTTMVVIFRYIIQIILLLVTRNYMITLFGGILITLLLNWGTSLWVTKKYEPVFSEKSQLDSNEKNNIFKDTSAAMLHKIGGTVLTSTDSLLLSKYIGLAITGIYSNYALIISSISGIVGMLFSSFTATLGNAHVTLDNNRRYEIYKKSLFINFWAVGLVTVCLYTLIDDFMFIWLKKPLYLGNATVILLCVQFYMENVRYVSTSYTMACGLFVKDKMRPLIEAIMNIVISIIALKLWGVAGIFLGTIVSCAFTVFWREPLLLYKFAFEKDVTQYWKEYIKNVFICISSIVLIEWIKTCLRTNTISIIGWVFLGIISFACYMMIHFIICHKSTEYRYFVDVIKAIWVKKIKMSN